MLLIKINLCTALINNYLIFKNVLNIIYIW